MEIVIFQICGITSEEKQWLSGQRDDQLAQAAISMPDIPFEIRPTCGEFCFQSEDLSINSNN